ncbi:MAG: molecular chaperone DnaK [Euryarchaeota archaeon]|nr:molecular chaperone DnaK [Euryarchaeota archaeon]
MAKIIGIDLGTTNSEAAYLEGGKPVVVPSAEGNTYGGKNFPSVVAFTKTGERLVGEAAKRQAVLNPERTITRIKRKMGTDYRVTIDDKTYSPEEISAMILQKIKHDAEAYLGEEVNKAVITVPAYFNDNQRQATKNAGKIAGLDVLRIVNEPTAAALAYGLEKASPQKVVVLDLGGGTFDVTIMDIGDGVFEVVSTSGDTQLGGSDMDDALASYVLGEFKKREGIDLSKDRGALQRIRDACEKAKMDLSSSLSAQVSLPFITQNETGPKHIEMTLTRSKMEQLVEPIIARCRKPIEDAFRDAKLEYSAVGKVLLVGGPTRMPIVRETFEKILGKKAEGGVDPMQCVAMGASVQGGIIGGEVKDIVLLDVTPLSLGVETLGNIMTKLIDRNTTIPTRKSQVFTTAADGQTSVEVHVLQGEREMAYDDISLGRFFLTGIPPAPRGVPQVEVTFDIDANGIVNVSAKDLATKKETKITITATSNLSKEEIAAKVKDAERFADEDKKKRERVELLNKADQTVYATRKMLEELGNKVTADKKKEVEDQIAKLEEALKAQDEAHIKAEMEALNKLLYKVSTELYQGVQSESQKQQAGQQPPPDQPQGGEGGGPGYVDADYKEVKDDKK